MPQESIRSAIARRMTHLGDELHILRAIEGLVRELEDHHPGTQVTLTDSAISIIVPLPGRAGGVETSDSGDAVSDLATETSEPVDEATERCAECQREDCDPEGKCRYPDCEPEPNPTPSAKHDGTDTPPPNWASPNWTADEDLHVWKMRDAGKTMREIAQALGRSEKAVSVRFYKRIKPAMEGGAASPAPTQPPPTAPEREPKPQEPEAPQAAEPKPGYAGPEDPLDNPRAMRRHLERLGSTAFWTPSNDLFLVEQVGRGRKLKDVAEDMGATKADAAARFRQLCPQPGIDTQQLLFEELRRRAGTAEAAQ